MVNKNHQNPFFFDKRKKTPKPLKGVYLNLKNINSENVLEAKLFFFETKSQNFSEITSTYFNFM